MADSAKENKISFFDGVKAEWSKIIWPNQDQLTKQTVAVVIVTIVVGVVISLLDTALQYGVNLLSM
ncbi:MAG: preprotein translocase subunit SecE [Lachnospiraceae bacterium]|jgi:preprotein translocase subunit SecE|nr:preprotein translocase subunit SecE [Lachnospiraceae bacterium]